MTSPTNPAADAAAPNTVLQVNDLSIDFRLRTQILHAVRNVSFTLERGKTLSLVGESGSGKSVTACSLLRLVDHNGTITGGSILLSRPGEAPLDLVSLPSGGPPGAPRSRAARSGLIFQEPMSSLSPVHTIGSQLIEVLRLHKGMTPAEARQRGIELLDSVEIPRAGEMIDRYTFEFSGGMRQRALIAMALAADPQILIADEPTTALDVTTQAEILDLIKRIQTEARHGHAADHARSRRGGGGRRRRGGDALRPHRRTGGRGHHLPRQPPPLYAPVARCDAQARERPASQRRVVAEPAPPLLCGAQPLQGLWRALEAVRQVRDRLRAVDDVSFELRRGENLGIVGEERFGQDHARPHAAPGRGADRRRDRISRSRRAGASMFAAPRPQAAADVPSRRPPRVPGSICFAEPAPDRAQRSSAIRWWWTASKSASEREARVAELLELVGLDPASAERYPHAFRRPAPAHRHRAGAWPSIRA